MAERLVEGYEQGELIGRGGSALVYRATQLRFGRAVALKVLTAPFDERTEARFVRECQALGRVSGHPSVITVHDAGTTSDHRGWLAMELLPDGSLADRLRRLGCLPLDEVVLVAEAVGGALDAAHRVGIVHRDVKPQNIMVSPYGRPVLSDFGIVAAADDDGTATTAFTPVHAAPELLEGGAATTASDVYALASTLWTLLTGVAPFARREGEGTLQHLQRVSAEEPPAADLATVAPPPVVDVLCAGLAKVPAERPLSATRLAEDLAAAARIRPAALLTPVDGDVAAPVPDEADESATVTGARRPPLSPAADPSRPAAETPSGDDDHEEATVIGARGRARPATSSDSEQPRRRGRTIVVGMVVLAVLVVGGALLGAILGNAGEPDDGEVSSTTAAPAEAATEQVTVPDLLSVTVDEDGSAGVSYRVTWATDGAEGQVVIFSRALDGDWERVAQDGVFPQATDGTATTAPLPAGARCFALAVIEDLESSGTDLDGALCVDEDGAQVDGPVDLTTTSAPP